MDPLLKRNIYPINNWEEFLEAGKAEFNQLREMVSASEYEKKDFNFIRTIGIGTFSSVHFTKLEKKGTYHAMKVVSKRKLVEAGHSARVCNEKKILQSLNHPFTVYLEYAFQDYANVYMCLPFIHGGELFLHLQMMMKFEECQARFFGAQVLLAIEYIHYCSVAYRDIKPENILLDRTGYLKMTDFGSCKVVPGRTYTFCGTPDYVAPEVLLSKGYGRAVDWWSFGVLLYELVVGSPPFQGKTEIETFENIVACRYKVPKSVSPELKNLIHNLLQEDSTKRYGNLANGVNDIKQHTWFKSVNWLSMLNNEIAPEITVRVRGDADSSHYPKQPEAEIEGSLTNEFGNLFDDF